MTAETRTHVVFGSGPLGQAVTRELVRRGKFVRVLNRSGKANTGLPAGVEVMAVDAYDPLGARQAAQGAQVVFQCAQPPYTRWVEEFPRLQNSILQAAEANGAKLVMGDNLYMYGPVDGPIHENLPPVAQTRKGALRARMAEALLDAHARGQVQVVIGRGSDFFGPEVTRSVAGETIFGNLARGKPASVLGNPDLTHTYTYINDFGRALVELSEHAEAYGQVWHVPNPETVTTREFVTLIAEEMGVQPRLQVAGPLLMRVLGLFNPDVREIVELAYQVTRPYVVDDRKYRRAFGDTATPLRDAIRQTVAWYRKR